LALAALLGLGACSGLEPRWLLRSLPGAYPDVVYYFPVDEPLLAITIDDGPHPATTAALLDLFAEYEAHATFFFVTDNVPGNEALVERALREGHELGNHMTRDEVSARLPPEDFAAKLAASSAVLERYAQVRWFRPGSAWYNAFMLKAIEPYGYRVMEASMIPLDARIAWPA
jgi:peptidoglycan/xylan/chitin deacetylase (PgdA/CDA1 family)